MGLYVIRKTISTDITKIVEIYNSNIKFLVNHLGVEQVDEKFIDKEIMDMKKSNFLSCVIIDLKTDEIIGVLDYKPDITVYLSLIMVHSKFQGKEVGNTIYKNFEQLMLQSQKESIRIDVVNDYTDNVIGFWTKQDFIAQKEIQLQWGDKKFKALVMTKSLI